MNPDDPNPDPTPPCLQARTKIRVICTRPYHALFMHNMLIRPTKAELENYGEPDFVIYNAGGFWPRFRFRLCGFGSNW